MPLIKTRGAASSQGFGQFALAVSGGDGTKGIFQLGSNNVGTRTTVRNKYTYACCTSTACGVGAASCANRWGSAAGNATRGIFALGCTCNIISNNYIRNKYTYATCASTACGVGTQSCGTFAGSAAGNATRGIFALGVKFLNSNQLNFRKLEKYTYSTCTSTALCAPAILTTSTGYGAAAGNSTRGIFAVGRTWYFCVCACVFVANPSNIRNKYTYACDTVTACGVATSSGNSMGASAAGNSTRGIFALGAFSGCPCAGNITATRNKYTYSSCTSTASGVGSASSASYQGSATGNSTRGIFQIGCRTSGCIAIRNKYTYACCTSTACGVANASANSKRSAAASWATGVNS